jgi:hypothetical protein
VNANPSWSDSKLLIKSFYDFSSIPQKLRVIYVAFWCNFT